MTLVANFGAYGTNANPFDHFAGVAMVPVLVHEFFLSDGEGAKFVAEAVFILESVNSRYQGYCNVEEANSEKRNF